MHKLFVKSFLVSRMKILHLSNKIDSIIFVLTHIELIYFYLFNKLNHKKCNKSPIFSQFMLTK